MTRKQLYLFIAGVVLILVIFGRHANYRSASTGSAGEPPMAGYADQMISSDSEESFALSDALSESDEGRMSQKSIAYPEPPMDGSIGADVSAEDRLIIHNATLRMLVSNVREALESFSALVKENGGFVVSTEADEDTLSPRGMASARVPADKLDGFLAGAKGLGEVEYETISGEDVTAEYVDSESQLKNLKATEAQFLLIMQRAVDIEDVLAVQRELSNVRSSIERLEGRMKYLRESAQYSLVTIHMATDPNDLPVLDEGDEWKPLAEVKEAVRALLFSLRNVGNAAIWLLVFAPLWLLIGGALFFFFRWMQKKNQRPM